MSEAEDIFTKWEKSGKRCDCDLCKRKEENARLS